MTTDSVATGPDGHDARAAAPGGPAHDEPTLIGLTASPRTLAGATVAGGPLPGRHRPLWARLGGGARRHWLFAVLLAVGAALRVLLMYAYRPAFEFSGDSYAYLTLAHLSRPDPMRPAGYPLLLRLLGDAGGLAIVPAAQHAVGLAIAVALYALLLHRGVRPVVAALATAPVLLDAYLIDIEHFVMAETLFLALLVAALVALLWSPRPSVLACGLAGLVLAGAGLVRTLGVVLGLLALAYVLVRRLGWPRLGAFGVFLAVPLVAYASWFHSYHGSYALTGGDAAWLYGRVAPIADCSRLDLTTEQLGLCSPHSPADRPGPNYYVWADTSPRFQVTGSEQHKNAVLAGFAHQVIQRQPADYARMVAADVGHYFLPGRNTGYRDWPVGSWQFPTADPPDYWHTSVPLLGLGGGHPARVINEPEAGWLRAYQRFGYAPGPLLAVLVVLALVATGLGLPRPRLSHGRLRRPWVLAAPPATVTAGSDARPGPAPRKPARPALEGLAALGLGESFADDPVTVVRDRGDGGAARRAEESAPPSRRAERRAARRGRRASQDPAVTERRRLSADCALLVALGVTVLVVPSATVCFDYRYLLPALVLFPPAAALAIRQFALSRRADPPPPRRLG
ncbi:hypothetical protein [Pseudofrankia sp. DC12]|uniref:hypothetical protein n=1 Tax=Pseudofrankia sp. DC12 TaxID=683315 RepID=UPI0005F83F6F|nr:hypothetical protein [Pseudofrankia sp. DC12]